MSMKVNIHTQQHTRKVLSNAIVVSSPGLTLICDNHGLLMEVQGTSQDPDAAVLSCSSAPFSVPLIMSLFSCASCIASKYGSASNLALRIERFFFFAPPSTHVSVSLSPLNKTKNTKQKPSAANIVPNGLFELVREALAILYLAGFQTEAEVSVPLSTT